MLITIAVAVAYATFAGKAIHSHDAAFAAPVTGLSLPGVSSSLPPSDQTVLRPLAINKTQRADVPVTEKQQETARLVTAPPPSPTPTAQPPVATQGDGVIRAAAIATPPPLPPYQVYAVAEGDSVSAIAQKFHIEPRYVLANNAEIPQSGLLVLGQSIIVPAGNGILHEVRLGETLSTIADRYNVPVEDITSFASNEITSPDAILESQLVFVPNAEPLPASALADAAPGASPTAADSQPTPETGNSSDDAPTPATEGSASSSSGLIWPLRGPISSYYGPSHPLGVDIDGFNSPGASVAAATSGTVVFAGGNACCSYGLYVVVMSPGGVETLYAHLSSISVSQGETVSQGEAIGVVGSTGYSTGRHLHFEVIDNGTREDPLSYLP